MCLNPDFERNNVPKTYCSLLFYWWVGEDPVILRGFLLSLHSWQWLQDCMGCPGLILGQEMLGCAMSYPQPQLCYLFGPCCNFLEENYCWVQNSFIYWLINWFGGLPMGSLKWFSGPSMPFKWFLAKLRLGFGVRVLRYCCSEFVVLGPER